MKLKSIVKVKGHIRDTEKMKTKTILYDYMIVFFL
jgi:hypothetical protein